MTLLLLFENTPAEEVTVDFTSAEATLGAITVDLASVGQSHIIAATEVTLGAPTVDTGTCAHIHDMGNGDPTLTPVCDTPTLAQVHNLTVVDATNLVYESNDFTLWNSDPGVSTIVQDVDSPLGVGTGWTITLASGVSGKWIWQGESTTAFSGRAIWAKAGTIDVIHIGGNGSYSDGVWFDVGAGTVGTTNSGKGTITAAADDWYYCEWETSDAEDFITITFCSADGDTQDWSASGGETILIARGRVFNAPPLTLGALLVEDASLTPENDLTAVDCTLGDPLCEVPTLAQVHVLISADATLNAPNVDRPPIVDFDGNGGSGTIAVMRRRRRQLAYWRRAA